jgi:hypothetical protein
MADLINAPGQETDGNDMFLNHLMNWGKDDSKGPPEKPEDQDPPEEEEETVEPTDDSSDEDDESSSEESDESEGEEQEPQRVYVDDDDAFAKVKVGDEEYEVPVKDLKRLYGQEASLTKKGQELYTQRQSLESEQQVTVAAQNALLQAARQRYEPYAKLDFLALSRDTRVSKEEFENLRREAQSRWEEVNFLEQQARGYAQNIANRNRELAKAEADQAVKEFKDPTSPYHIEGWAPSVYDEVRTFAIGKGIPQKIVDGVTNAAIIKVFHTAMRFEKGAQLKDVKTVKVNKSVKKVIKQTNSPAADASRQSSADRSKFGDKDKALAKLKRTGKQADAENAFLASFREFESD